MKGFDKRKKKTLQSQKKSRHGSNAAIDSSQPCQVGMVSPVKKRQPAE